MISTKVLNPSNPTILMNKVSIIIISCLGILVYSNTFLCSFHLDDFASILNNFAIINIHHLHNIWIFLPRRFVLYLSLALNYHFNGVHVMGYHLLNLAVHLLAGIFVWWLTLLTLSTPVMKEDKIVGRSNIIALFAALVFISHPLQTEAVTYIVQRAASMAALFYLASLCFYIKSRLLQTDGSRGGSWQLYYIGSWMMAIVAMFTKENAITLPLMILLYEVIFLSSNRKLVVPWRYLAPFLLTLFIIPLTMLFTENNPGRLQCLRNEPGISPIHYLLTEFRVMVTYIRLSFIPLNQNLDYDYPIFKNFFEWPVLFSFIFLMTVLFWAKCYFCKYRLVSFSIFWFFLTLLPESSLLPIKDVIFEHRLYLPLVGFSLFLVSSLYYLWGKNSIKLMVSILMVIIAFFSILTFQRNKVWKDEITLWDDAVQKSSHKARAYEGRGFAYWEQGNLKQAKGNFDKAIELDPGLAEAYGNRGAVYLKEGNFKQAMVDLNKAIEIAPQLTEAYGNRGVIYDMQGKFTQALSDFNKAIALDPNNVKAHHNLDFFLSRHGR